MYFCILHVYTYLYIHREIPIEPKYILIFNLVFCCIFDIVTAAASSLRWKYSPYVGLGLSYVAQCARNVIYCHQMLILL